MFSTVLYMNYNGFYEFPNKILMRGINKLNPSNVSKLFQLHPTTTTSVAERVLCC